MAGCCSHKWSLAFMHTHQQSRPALVAAAGRTTATKRTRLPTLTGCRNVAELKRWHWRCRPAAQLELGAASGTYSSMRCAARCGLTTPHSSSVAPALGEAVVCVPVVNSAAACAARRACCRSQPPASEAATQLAQIRSYCCPHHEEAALSQGCTGSAGIAHHRQCRVCWRPEGESAYA